ncbi:MAG: OmpA family protein [Pyrinomonadaceae bacterium]|nr:OmpA family protein [Pyrinomonadaceae bacterium]
MSAKIGILLAALALLLLFILCPWRHWQEIAAIQGGGQNIAANNNTNVNANLAAPTLKIASEGGKFRLTGTVPDEATKQQIIDKAKAVYGEGNFIDEIKVGGVSKPSWLQSVLTLLPFTKNGVTNGGLSVQANSISLVGEVPTQADKDRIYAEASKSCPPNTTINNLLTVVGQKALSEEQVKVQVKLNEAIAGKVIEFETGSNNLTEKGKAVLDEFIPILKDSTDHLEIDGHTDNQGNPASNKLLSQRRAETVKNYLVDKQIDKNRLTTKGFGQEKPIADNNTETGRQRNRRIEFQVLGGEK